MARKAPRKASPKIVRRRRKPGAWSKAKGERGMRRPPFEDIDSGRERFIAGKTIHVRILIEITDSMGERHTQDMQTIASAIKLYSDNRMMIFPIGYKEPEEDTKDPNAPAEKPPKKKRPKAAKKRRTR